MEIFKHYVDLGIPELALDRICDVKYPVTFKMFLTLIDICYYSALSIPDKDHKQTWFDRFDGIINTYFNSAQIKLLENEISTEQLETTNRMLKKIYVEFYDVTESRKKSKVLVL